MPLLELKSLSAAYSGHPVLHGIDLFIERGEIVTLVGANGAGKSTLVKSISGLLRPLSGEVVYDGIQVGSLPSSQRLRLGIAHVPEGRQIFGGMTVRENLELGAYASAGFDKAEQLEMVCDLFPVLKSRMNDMAGNFSGGQQQMLAIARGLMSKPQVLLLDEPSLGIAPLLVAEIFRLIDKLRDQGIAILLAEQNARQALSIADRGYVFENGRATLSGPSKELLASREVAERYLGIGTGTEVGSADSENLAKRLKAALVREPARSA